MTDEPVTPTCMAVVGGSAGDPGGTLSYCGLPIKMLRHATKDIGWVHRDTSLLDHEAIPEPVTPARETPPDEPQMEEAGMALNGLVKHDVINVPLQSGLAWERVTEMVYRAFGLDEAGSSEFMGALVEWIGERDAMLRPTVPDLSDGRQETEALSNASRNWEAQAEFEQDAKNHYASRALAVEGEAEALREALRLIVSSEPESWATSIARAALAAQENARG